MRKLALKLSLTLDGFLCGPNGEMDWFAQSRSEDGAAWTLEKISGAGAHLVGRKTFLDFAKFWPTAQGPFAKPMNEIPKIVFSRTGFEVPKLEADSWHDPLILNGNLVEEIRKLKSEGGKTLVAQGGADFTQSLVATRLIDEYWLAIHPTAIGQGKSLFAKLESPLDLKLVESKTFSSGTIGCVYTP